MIRRREFLISSGLAASAAGALSQSADRAKADRAKMDRVAIMSYSFNLILPGDAVIKPIFDPTFKADLWMPLAFPPAESAPGVSGPHNIDVIGRLRPNTTIEQAQDEFRRIAAKMVELYPNQDKKFLGFSIERRQRAAVPPLLA